MWPQDTKNYMHQMKRTLQMQKINKEKEMQQEIMSLKAENATLKDEIRQFADWMSIIARQLKDATRENERLKKENFQKKIYIPVKV